MSGFVSLARQLHPSVEAAFVLAREWCAGHEIDGGPALGHAVKVTNLIGHHAPQAPTHVLAACLLHDAPDLAPDQEEMASRITDRCGVEVLDLINHLHAEHEVLNRPTGQNTAAHLETLVRVPWLLHTATADKVVAMEYVTGRAAADPDADAFWVARPAFVRLIPYFLRVHQVGLGVIPRSLSDAYGQALARCPAPRVD